MNTIGLMETNRSNLWTNQAYEQIDLSSHENIGINREDPHQQGLPAPLSFFA